MNKLKSKFSLTRFFIFTMILATIARFVWIFTIPNIPVSDFGEYQRIAEGLAKGMIPSGLGYQGIGYPAFLSIFYKIFGSSNILIAKVLNVFLSILTLWFTFIILKRILKNTYLIAVIFFIIALLPNHIAYTSVVGTEVLTNFLFSIIIFLQVSNLKNKYKFPLLGILIGLATLTKPYFLAYPFLLMVIEWLNKKDLKQTILIGVVTFIMLEITISPWTIFNYERYGKLVPASFNGGLVLYINNNSENQTGHYMDSGQVKKTPQFAKKISKLEPKSPESSQAYQAEAIKWIKGHPIEFARLGKYRVQNAFLITTTPWDIPQYTMDGINPSSLSGKKLMSYNLIYNSISSFLHYMIEIGFLYGLIKLFEIFFSLFSLKKKLDYYKLVPTLNILMFVAIYFVFEGQPRYNYPVLFLLVINAVLFFKMVFNGILRLKTLIKNR